MFEIHPITPSSCFVGLGWQPNEPHLWFVTTNKKWELEATILHPTVIWEKKKNKAFDTSYNEWQNNISDMRQVVFVSWKSFLYICPMGCVAAQLCVAKQEKFVSSEWLRACRANWNPAHFFIIGSFFFVISLVIDFFPIWKKMRLLLTVMTVLYIVARSVKAAFRPSPRATRYSLGHLNASTALLHYNLCIPTMFLISHCSS